LLRKKFVATQNLAVPDIGGSENVEVIEVCVKPGDIVKKDDSLLVLESDKASMEVPAPMAGTVKSIQLKVGDKVSQGSAMLILETDTAVASEKQGAQEKKPAEKVAAPAAPVPTKAAAPVKNTAQRCG